MKKRLYLIFGWLLLALAAIGVLLPVLPTTPFVIAASLCFSVGDPRISERLESSRIFGPYITGYRTKQGITIRQKARAICCLWVLLLISILITRKLWLAALLGVVGIGVTIHLISLKTKKTSNI